MDRGHQERLAPLAQEVMARAGLAFAELDRIAVTLGPGSFTGLRVGLAFAKGLGLALDRPVIGLGCLEVLAAPFAGSPGRTLVLLPGRGEAICHQVFEDGIALGPPALGPEADLEALAPVARILGAIDLAPGSLSGAERLALAAPDVAVAAQMAVLRPPGPLIPLYMRPPDARLPGGRLPE
jgi:tRNA threonylcarbamoyladenosine biosynthesis protein TsaB